ncbi:MAG: DUF4892 domain-containing protein [Oleiphilaceae bacterium]|nr:DUF4892 domain-containing protein [Oleiphilaceae bacterium]
MTHSLMARSLMTTLCWLVVPLMALPGLSQAADPGLPLFPQGTLERSTSLEKQPYRLYAGAVREVRGEAVSGNSLELEMAGKKRLISTARGVSLEAVKAHYHKALEARQAEVVFSCTGRSCGSSNVWANEVFDESTLYGRDEDQFYRVSAWRDANDRVQLNSLYIVQRGNRQVMVHEQAFRLPKGGSLPGLELTQRRVFGPVVIPWSVGDEPAPGDDHLSQIRQLASQYPEGHLYLMGYAPLNEGTLSQLMDRVDKATDSMAQRLQEEGIARDRLRRRSIGPLVSPATSGRSGARIEVMLVRETIND